MSFLESLRMQNIFPNQNGGQTPFGMPNFDMGSARSPSLSAENLIGLMLDQKKQDRQHEFNLIDRHQQGKLGQIGAAIAAKEPISDNRTIFQPSMTDFQRGTLGIRQQDLNQRGSIADDKNLLAQQKLASDVDALTLEAAKQSGRMDLADANNVSRQVVADKGIAGRAATTDANIAGRADVAGKNIEGREVQTNADIADRQLRAADEIQARDNQSQSEIIGRQILSDRNNAAAKDLATTKAEAPYMITDPNDPTKQITVALNPITKKVEPVTMGGNQIGPITKPGGPTKASNGTMQPPAEKLSKLREQAQSVIDIWKEVFDEKTGKLHPDAARAVGGTRMLGGHWIPIQHGRAGEAKINQLKGKTVLALIDEMKSQSKTGATGFGQMNLAELLLLEKAANKLDPYMSEGDFEAEGKVIIDKLRKLMQPVDGFDESKVPAIGNSTSNPTGNRPSAASLIKKYGGKQ